MRTIFVLSLSLLAVGCGDDASTEVTEVISAAAGGTISLEASVLRIPAAALQVDTEVSMRLDPIADLAPLADGHDLVLTIEPAATTLAVAASLTLDLGGPVAAGERVTAYHFVDGAWAALESQEVSGGLIQTSVTGLGSFALRRETPDLGGGNQIVGTLRLNDGSPVGGAPVQLFVSGSPLADTVTGDSGAFTFVDLSPGAYTLVVSFECELSQDVTVTAEAATEVDLVLCPS